VQTDTISPYRIIRQRPVGWLRITHFAQAPQSAIPRHYHEHATLCVLARGTARDGFRNRVIEYGPGAVIYRPPGEPHSHAFGRDGMVAVVIEIPTARLQGDLAWPALRELQFQGNAPALGIVTRLLRDLRRPAIADADLEETCYSLLTVFRRDGSHASTSSGIERVRLFLDDCPAQKTSLAQLGAMAGLHPAYLVNAFRKRYGLSIGQYRRQRRVSLAIRQLWNTDLRLAELAVASGYYDQSHCTNELRKHLQLTPLEIRDIMPTFTSSNTYRDESATV
jgi:AraC family transcriptional regulator